MNRFFEYCRFRTPPRGLQNAPDASWQQFQDRAVASGGKLFGCWRSLIGLGLARDEGIALTSWPTEALARAAPVVEAADSHLLEATVRPPTDDETTYDGVCVFRWFEVAASDWQSFLAISEAAWPNMEGVFDVNICGFWRSLETPAPSSHTLLLTRYADLSVWEASRWWNNPPPAADESMSRFKARNDLIQATVAYPALQVGR